MTIGMLLNAPYPADVRIRKEAAALQAAGHRIHLLCLRRKDEPYQDTSDGIAITRIDAGKNNIALALWDIMMSLTFEHPVFKKKIPAWISENNIEVLHVHDLPLAGTALATKKKINIPVIADFHENYPDALQVWFKWKKNPLAHLKNVLFMNPTRWRKHEAKTVRHADYVIAVVDEMRNRLISEYRADPNKIIIVTNSEDQSFLQQPLDSAIYKEYEGKFIVTYTGGIGPHRGVDTAIGAMQYLKDKNVVLIVAGFGNETVMKNLRHLADELGVAHKVHFLGKQSFSRFYSLMHFADVNIIPHKSTPHTDNTIPHKLFQGMMAGKPMLVSSSAPLKRIIENTKAGLVFTAGDANDLSEKILQLIHDNALCRQLGQNGVQATASGGMNWETDQQSLLHLYQQLEYSLKK
ncbi:MAG: glycosyltransferase family 4 protein [Flammeovirgaceae bacterium]|nr:MAG: glycosyltransferase family 4 protein [Flammeovirgaceae bacterium]